MFTLALPWALLLLPLPWIMRKYLREATIAFGAALKMPFYNKVVALNRRHHTPVIQQKFLHYLAYLTWVLLVFASSGPQWIGAAVQMPQNGRNIMLVMDLSGSMQIPDMQLNGQSTDRLSMVKEVAKRFVAARQGDKLGLVLFGTRAYLQTPLTFDRKTVQHMLDDATIGLAGPQTAIGDALGLAVKHFANTPQKSRVIILLTDGASNAGVLKPLQATELAERQHIKVYTIGLGAKQLLVPGIFGTQVINPSADLDEGTLKKIAESTQGLFFRAENTEDLQKVYNQIDKLEPIVQDQIMFRPITSYYYWPLALAFLFSLYFTWRLTQPWLIFHLLRDK